MNYPSARTAINTTVHKFESWSEWVEAIQAPPAVPDSSATQTRRSNGADWYGNATYKQAVKLAANGWAEGVGLVKIQADRIGSILSSLVEQTHYNYDVEGQTFDVATYLSGVPECWQVPVPVKVENQGSRLVKVTVCAGGMHKRSADEYRTRGAAICAMIQVLELNGYACEVWFSRSVDNLNLSETSPLKFQTILVRIKDYDNSLDVDRLAFALSHPAQFRRLAFGHTESVTGKSIKALLTRSVDTEPEYHGDIYIDLNDGVYGSDVEAAEWARKKIAKIQGRD